MTEPVTIRLDSHGDTTTVTIICCDRAISTTWNFDSETAAEDFVDALRRFPYVDSLGTEIEIVEEVWS
tara:strand:+ start:454 stop:657 length:204 start_codon:yes stop_codon:yes gene_type:complete